jgi:prepilin-type processing-associated H-X9-DG protein
LAEESLYAQYRFDEPWNSPHNMALAGRMPAVFHCPADNATDGSKTSYVMVVGPHAVSDGLASRHLGEIKDNGAGTIIVLEVAYANINWLEPRDLNIKDATLLFGAVRNHSPEHDSGLASPHTHAINVLFCDGTVQTLDNKVNEEDVKAMLPVAGGDAVPTR